MRLCLSLPSSISIFLIIYFIFHVVGSEQDPLCPPTNEDLGTLAEYDPLTGFEPNGYHFSEDR